MQTKKVFSKLQMQMLIQLLCSAMLCLRNIRENHSMAAKPQYFNMPLLK